MSKVTKLRELEKDIMDETNTDQFNELTSKDEGALCRTGLAEETVSMIADLPPEIGLEATTSIAKNLPLELQSKLVVSLLGNLTQDAQIHIFGAWMRASAKDLKFVERIASSAAFVLRTEGLTKQDDSGPEEYFEKRLGKEPWVTPTQLVAEYARSHRYWARRKKELLEIAQKVDKRVVTRLTKQYKSRGEKFSVRTLRAMNARPKRTRKNNRGYRSEVGLLHGLSVDMDTLPPGPETYTRTYFDPSRLVEEYREPLQRHRVYHLAANLAQLLLQFERYPSVVPLEEQARDTERDYLCEDTLLYSVLSRVPLLEHTVRVAREIIEVTKADRLEVVPGLIAALAHDIGKTPEARSHLGSSMPNQEHNIVSADFLTRQLSAVNPGWADLVVSAVRKHHLGDRESRLEEELYRAEAAARRLEIYAEAFGDHSPGPLQDWLRPEEFVLSMEPHINVLKANRFEAVLWNGSLYCNINFVFDHAKRFAAQQNVIDYRFARPTDRQEILLEIVDKLRSKGLVCGNLRAGAYHRSYRIDYGDQGRLRSIKLYLLEIRSDEWRSEWLRKIGARRQGYLRDIAKISPTVPDFKGGATL